MVKARRGATTDPQALLLVGTMKGAFIFRSDESRKKWRMDGPHFRGEAVYALLHDTRAGRMRTYAATNSMHWGPTVRALERIMDERGSVRRHMNVFVDGESIRFMDGLNTPSPEGSTILVLAAVSGG